jgi:hypothetical protein
LNVDGEARRIEKVENFTIEPYWVMENIVLLASSEEIGSACNSFKE